MHVATNLDHASDKPFAQPTRGFFPRTGETGGASAIREATRGHPRARRDRDRRRALDVVVVRQELLAVLGEQGEGVVRVEVLELQQALGAEERGRRRHELADERVRAVVRRVDHRLRRGRVRDAVLLEAGVERVAADVELG